jgi:hypothetical protein
VERDEPLRKVGKVDANGRSNAKERANKIRVAMNFMKAQKRGLGQLIYWLV